ncbi:MAG: uridylate kinase [bacterium]|nr:uridylate kinase [bacterium]
MSITSELVLVKLGGSLITDKRGEATARTVVIRRLANEIAAARADLPWRLILGHGSGSFGHVAAARYDLGRGLIRAGRSAPLAGVSVTQDQAARLHRLVIEALLRAGAMPFSVVPSSTLLARKGRPVGGTLEPLVCALERGLLPVVYGDVVMDQVWGAAICSTESVLRYLVMRLDRHGFRVRRLLWLGETDGVYDRDGKTIPRIDRENYRRILKLVEPPAGTDVTGGMLLRLKTARALARCGVESQLVNGMQPGLLAAGLAGEEIPGTRFVADPLE